MRFAVEGLIGRFLQKGLLVLSFKRLEQDLSTITKITIIDNKKIKKKTQKWSRVPTVTANT